MFSQGSISHKYKKKRSKIIPFIYSQCDQNTVAKIMALEIIYIKWFTSSTNWLSFTLCGFQWPNWYFSMVLQLNAGLIVLLWKIPILVYVCKIGPQLKCTVHICVNWLCDFTWFPLKLNSIQWNAEINSQ